MEIRIISSEIIKPSSPTPPHLKTHNLSLIDQLNLNIYFGYPLFYNRGDKSVVEISDHLKRSLSKTLTHYYPFAGRVRHDSFVDCDDSGVPFIEAYVDINMFEVLRKPEMNILEQLLPYNPNKKVSTDDHPNLAVQINYFDCGGFAVCACFRHLIADASAAALFLKNWAAVARGFSDIKDVVFDCSSIFPPNELAKNITKNTIERQRSIDCVSKRFTFDGTKIASLIKEIANRFKHRRRPTRFEVVSALIWGALISMAKESGDASPFILTPLNVRKRMNPPFPEECIGNVIFCVTGNWLDNEAVDYSSLANKIHQLVRC
ncbi:Transferase [Melia azedarach]|uniref:Transferase n=1 Tax=Melia azedarach TaxID=155640 RepID=A0ACC1XR34_MELAZ|nr:Transferase [Melia azedarach]